jgi:hypothetical protein
LKNPTHVTATHKGVVDAVVQSDAQNNVKNDIVKEFTPFLHIILDIIFAPATLLSAAGLADTYSLRGGDLVTSPAGGVVFLF